MSISTPPPPAPPKKKGMGCLGCGCLILVLLVILILGLVAAASYFGYTKAISLTSTTPASIPSFNGSDDLYASAKQKIAGFYHDVKNHQAATISLSADEINTLIAHSPDLTAKNTHLFVTLDGDQARIQGAIPTDRFIQGLLQGRFINVDTSFGINFNAGSKTIELNLHALQIGDQNTPDKLLPTMQAELNPIVNAGLQKDPDYKALLDQAKTIQIKDGQLVIETQ